MSRRRTIGLDETQKLDRKGTEAGILGKHGNGAVKETQQTKKFIIQYQKPSWWSPDTLFLCQHLTSAWPKVSLTSASEQELESYDSGLSNISGFYYHGYNYQQPLKCGEPDELVLCRQARDTQSNRVYQQLHVLRDKKCCKCDLWNEKWHNYCNKCGDMFQKPALDQQGWVISPIDRSRPRVCEL